MTDDIQKVREAALNAYFDSTAHRGSISVFSAEWDAFILDFAKRLQPRPEPVKKVWSVSDGTVDLWVKKWYGPMTQPSMKSILNAIASDIIRERPDLVAAEFERRFKIHFPKAFTESVWRHRLFPELDP